MKTCKVGVDVAVDGEVASWRINCAFVGSAMQIADNCFDGGSMTLFRAVVEPGNLSDSKCNVWACVS